MGCAQSLSNRFLSVGGLFDVEVYDPATQKDVSFTSICAEEKQAEAMTARRQAGYQQRQLENNRNVTTLAAVQLQGDTDTTMTSRASASLPSGSGNLASQWLSTSQEAKEQV